MANEGLISHLCNREDLSVSDELNHVSIIDRVRLSHTDRAVQKQMDVENLTTVMEEAERHDPPYRHIWIITEGVFSLDSDLTHFLRPGAESHTSSLPVMCPPTTPEVSDKDPISIRAKAKKLLPQVTTAMLILLDFE